MEFLCILISSGSVNHDEEFLWLAANFPIPISVPHELGLKSGLKGEIEKQLELLINCELDDFKWIASDDQEKFERKIGQLAINLFMGD